ncbi:MAG TPA: STAS domain-containing protein [Acidimicrobiales bacterium]|nr:STAS domain-containing protein [Acidimicrobiales bacterium]
MVVVIKTPEIDRRAVEAFQCELANAVGAYRVDASPDVPLTLDLRHVAFMDSTGIRCLIDADRAVTAVGGRMELLVEGIPRRLLEVTGLLERFEPVPDVFDLREAAS